jgi:hypothetical protein
MPFAFFPWTSVSSLSRIVPPLPLDACSPLLSSSSLDSWLDLSPFFVLDFSITVRLDFLAAFTFTCASPFSTISSKLSRMR